MGIDGIFPNGLALADALELLWPLLVVVLGMTAYAVFVFKFYRFVAARDMFKLNLAGGDERGGNAFRNLIRLVWYAVRYVILFPACAFFWFAVLSLVLALLSKDRSLDSILLIAMATVSAVRVAAYYNEELSRDLAKMLPFAVLGVFIIETDSLDAITSLSVFGEASEHRETILYYLLFLVALEFALRLIFAFFKLLFPGKPKAQTGARAAGASGATPAEPPPRQPTYDTTAESDGANHPSAASVGDETSGNEGDAGNTPA